MTTVTDTPQTDTALLPLLQRLAELAPEICLYEPVGFGQIHRFRLSGSVSAIIDLVEGQDIAAIDYAVLQWVLQEAIAARGFVIDAEMYRHADTQELRWDTFVYNKGRIAIDGSSFGCDDTNQAIALLSAFLQAVEAA